MWVNSLNTYVWIFSVGRGNAAFIRSPLNQGFIVDMGSSDEFSPADFVDKVFSSKLDPYEKPGSMGNAKQPTPRIAQALLSHPHIDHIAECGALAQGSRLHPSLLTCPHDKEGSEKSEQLNWDRIKNPGNATGAIEKYRSLFAKRSLPLQSIEFNSRRTVPNFEYGIYYVRPPYCESLHPADDNQYGNATSIMMYLRHGDHSILFPGDMTPEGMKHVLYEGNGLEKRYTIFDQNASREKPTWHTRTSDQPSLFKVLGERGLTVLVAPHHGLESCYSTDLYRAVRGGRPNLVIISERRHSSPKDGKVDSRYQSESGAFGMRVEQDGVVQNRRSISTVQGHHVLVIFSGTGRPVVHLDKDPKQLLRKMNG